MLWCFLLNTKILKNINKGVNYWLVKIWVLNLDHWTWLCKKTHMLTNLTCRHVWVRRRSTKNILSLLPPKLMHMSGTPKPWFPQALHKALGIASRASNLFWISVKLCCILTMSKMWRKGSIHYIWYDSVSFKDIWGGSSKH